MISGPIAFSVAGFILGPDGFLPHGPTPTFPDKAVICGAMAELSEGIVKKRRWMLHSLWNPLLPSVDFILMTCAAVAAPTLEQTELYSKITNGCRSIVLDHWRHPTVQVLNKADVGLSKVELCNLGKYPILTVHFKYDPRASTSSYFDPLYARMAAANGFWPFSFVDADDNVVIHVSISSTHRLSISYEDYAPLAIAPLAPQPRGP